MLDTWLKDSNPCNQTQRRDNSGAFLGPKMKIPHVQWSDLSPYSGSFPAVRDFRIRRFTLPQLQCQGILLAKSQFCSCSHHWHSFAGLYRATPDWYNLMGCLIRGYQVLMADYNTFWAELLLLGGAVPVFTG